MLEHQHCTKQVKTLLLTIFGTGMFGGVIHQAVITLIPQVTWYDHQCLEIFFNTFDPTQYDNAVPVIHLVLSDIKNIYTSDYYIDPWVNIEELKLEAHCWSMGMAFCEKQSI